MKTLFLIVAVITSLLSTAQTINRKWTNEIYFDASKESLIKTVIKKVKDYYLNDEDGIIKKMQKQKKVKLDKMEKRIEFLARIESVIEATLTNTDNWGWEELKSIRTDYLINVNQLLCRDLFFVGCGKPNTGSNQEGSITLTFNKKKLSAIYAYMSTIKDNHIANGYSYTDFTLGELSRVIRSDLGEFTHERRQWSWNMCSADKAEPVYYEKFNVNDGEYTGWVEAEFGAYIYRIDKNNCRYRGNQLTAVTMSFAMNK